ncbi:MAG TPA: alkaline phosphatase family protein [Acidobacteriota bacterium]|nr:alkaline phosphatase family protein [Acidobacteriota bacterium]
MKMLAQTLMSLALATVLAVSGMAQAPSAAEQSPAAPSPNVAGQPAGQSAESPRLIVFITVDQYRADYLTRFSDLYLPPRDGQGRPGGFRFLSEEGADYRAAAYQHYETFTCPGHASLVTGAVPAVHGIIGNGWYDRKARRWLWSCTMGLDEAPSGPQRLMVSTIGDEMKLAWGGRSKVVSIAVKDYAAILMGGRRADSVLWLDRHTGLWTSNENYGDLPQWAVAVNESKPMDAAAGKQWTPLLDPQRYWHLLPWRDQTGTTFTHDYGWPQNPNFYNSLARRPPANEMLFDTLEKAVQEGQLGSDEVPDLLLVSLSSNDYTGHDFGPFSPELLDITVRSDRLLSSFFAALEDQVGLDRTLIVLSSDHGVTPVPDRLREAGVPAGRVGMDEFLNPVDEMLDSIYGEADWIWGFNKNDVYINHDAVYDLAEGDLEKVCEIAAQVLELNGAVYSVYTRADLLEGDYPPSPYGKMLANGYHPKRGGDVVVLFRPHHFPGDLTTTHGTIHAYDRRVPVLLRGPGIRAGTYYRKVSPTDIVPTLCQVLGIGYPAGASGQPLREALKAQ